MLVYFYPKADTPGCTQQSCGLRDAAPKIGDTVVLGISPDKPAKQKKFDDKYGLGFPLLADEDHAVAEEYDVWTEKSMYGRKYMGILRSAFLVDEKGKIAEAWYKVSPKDTAANLLKSIGDVAASGRSIPPPRIDDCLDVEGGDRRRRARHRGAVDLGGRGG